MESISLMGRLLCWLRSLILRRLAALAIFLHGSLVEAWDESDLTDPDLWFSFLAGLWQKSEFIQLEAK